MDERRREVSVSGARSGVRSKERSALEVSARFMSSFAIWSAGEIVRALMSDKTGYRGRGEEGRGRKDRSGGRREKGRGGYLEERDDCGVDVAEDHTHKRERST